MTRDDLLAALRGEMKAEEAIFWWAFAWNSGPRSDLYRVLCQSPYFPTEQRRAQIEQDLDILRCWDILGDKFGRASEVELRPVRYDDLMEGDVITADPTMYPCISKKWKWPSKVFREPTLDYFVVVCERGFHRVPRDPNGFVTGFSR